MNQIDDLIKDLENNPNDVITKRYMLDRLRSIERHDNMFGIELPRFNNNKRTGASQDGIKTGDPP